MIKELGQGSYGHVYRCQHKVTGHVYACKKMNKKHIFHPYKQMDK